MRVTISKVNRQIVGYYEIDSSGNKTVRDIASRILGYYDSSRDVTMTVSRQIIAYGDVTGIFFKDQIYF